MEHLGGQLGWKPEPGMVTLMLKGRKLRHYGRKGNYNTVQWPQGPGKGPQVTQRPSETFGELSFVHPSPEPYCFQVAGPKAPWNQAVTTHEQEITRGTCRLSKDGSVGRPSLLLNNSPRCAANICAFRQQAEGSYRRTGLISLITNTRANLGHCANTQSLQRATL